ncbi:response regulator [bacterium]|nr:response regulator [bacterium]
MKSTEAGANDRPRVLLVDDDVMVLAILEAQLGPTCDCVAVDDARVALEKLAEQQFDVIVSDQVMPYMTGDQLLAKAAESWPEVERLLITGYADLGSVVKAVNAGKISHYLAKPWQGEELAEAVRAAYLRCRNVRQQKADLEHACAEKRQALAALEEGWEFLKEVTQLPRKPGPKARAEGQQRGSQQLLRAVNGEPMLFEVLPD